LNSIFVSLGLLTLVALPAAAVETRPISELTVVTKTHLGKTADWVALTTDAVWVGSTGPFAVHRIDPMTGKRIATVKLQGEPCAGLASGFGSLWIPLCGPKPGLAKVDVGTNRLIRTFAIHPAAAEGGITTSEDSVWMVVDKSGSLARIDPASGSVRQTIRVPAGSYNPHYSDGQVWISRAAGDEITSVDAHTGSVTASVKTGPGPRFLTHGAGAIWTLNQGDGSLTRIDSGPGHHTKTVALGTPGHGGDIAFGEETIWTTMPKFPLSAIDAATASLRCQWVGPGGDSLGVGHGAIWLTDYKGGSISQIALAETLRSCPTRPAK
jgi:virginiamycin B lyase